jgi:hypothetical protein
VGDAKMERAVDYDVAAEAAEVLDICGEGLLTGY